GVREFAALEGLHYDVIHSHYWLSGVVANELRKFWGAPFVHMAHTLGLMKNRIAQRPDERESDLRLTTEVQIINWADCIIAATLAEKSQLEILLQADTRRLEVIPPGVDVNMFHPIPMAEAKAAIGTPKDSTMLLFVGRIEPLKGADTLLRAMKLLEDRGAMPENLCLAIIGGDPSDDAALENAEMDRLKTLREELGLDNNVTFLGKRDQDALNNYYAAAQAVIMPSHYESFGMVALEAMACGTPVIASEVGGLAFLVRDGETGFHVPDRDPEALCDCLQELLGRPELRQKLGQQAAEYARSYAWPLVADKIVRVYEEVVSERG
ncbi:MAG TPA: glycosyltransferase, partial [Anaerolineae bacterium]